MIVSINQVLVVPPVTCVTIQCDWEFRIDFSSHARGIHHHPPTICPILRASAQLRCNRLYAKRVCSLIHIMTRNDRYIVDLDIQPMSDTAKTKDQVHDVFGIRVCDKKGKKLYSMHKDLLCPHREPGDQTTSTGLYTDIRTFCWPI